MPRCDKSRFVYDDPDRAGGDVTVVAAPPGISLALREILRVSLVGACMFVIFANKLHNSCDLINRPIILMGALPATFRPAA